MIGSLWASPEADQGDSGLRVNPGYLVARSKAYDARVKAQGEPAGGNPTPGPGESIAQWTPLPPDIQDASALFEYLSPQVRRLAIAVEARLREPERARRKPEYERPQALFNRMIAEAQGLLEAVRNPSVVDRFVRPLPMDHPDRNPRRVLNVLREAANVGCYLLLIADVCGAMEESGTQ
jgi:NTP pyrophosphatase (non-canonical NTP hydrolase)